MRILRYIRGPQRELGKHATRRAVTCRDLHSQPQLSHSASWRKWAPRDRLIEARLGCWLTAPTVLARSHARRHKQTNKLVTEQKYLLTLQLHGELGAFEIVAPIWYY